MLYTCFVGFIGSNKKPMATLDQLQARFARALLKKKKIAFDYTSSKSVLNSKRSLESLAYRRQIISLTTFHRYVFRHRDYLADFHFKITNSERRPNKIILPKFKSLSKSLFMFRTAILWNCLPPSLTSEASLYKFKAALRKFTADYAYAINGIPPPCS